MFRGAAALVVADGMLLAVVAVGAASTAPAHAPAAAAEPPVWDLAAAVVDAEVVVDAGKAKRKEQRDEINIPE